MQTDDAEEWRPVVGYEDRYEVSSLGRVRSSRDGLLLRGYCRPAVILCRKGAKPKNVAVHTLVIEAFHGPKPSPRHEALHGDGNSQNNRNTNLRWGTRRENREDSTRHGTSRSQRQHSELNARAKLSADQVEMIRFFAGPKPAAPGRRTVRYADLAEFYGVNKSYIAKIVSGEKWLTPPAK